ncbi:hypothetical protein PoB_002553500 [Plakobranchus ocellatus]|uniref:Uncharacterized protein n=1 Tax=Plakobranchus ocellatus TaxID=259542 RepID=A0AAV3ZV26_9GAST|nr:hypothetical protein PoB_002553500 [Plakobranchus ocellatus]
MKLAGLKLRKRLFFPCRSTPRSSQAFRSPVRPGRPWRGSNPRHKGPCRSQGGLASPWFRNVQPQVVWGSEESHFSVPPGHTKVESFMLELLAPTPLPDIGVFMNRKKEEKGVKEEEGEEEEEKGEEKGEEEGEEEEEKEEEEGEEEEEKEEEEGEKEEEEGEEEEEKDEKEKEKQEDQFDPKCRH